MAKLSAAARKKISDSMRRAWAERRARQPGAGPAAPSRSQPPKRASPSGNHALSRITQATDALKRLTLADLRSLSSHKGAAAHVADLARLASDLKGLLGRS